MDYYTFSIPSMKQSSIVQSAGSLSYTLQDIEPAPVLCASSQTLAMPQSYSHFVFCSVYIV
jgi:hypothetical protein